MVGRTRYRLPLEPTLARKFDALGEELDLRVLGSAADGSPTADATFRLVPAARPSSLDGALFYATLPVRLARELRRSRPDAVLAQSPYEAAAALLARTLARSRSRVVVDVHGDWRTFTRLYGSAYRRALAPLADGVAAAAIRHADAVRSVSPYTTAIVREAGVEPAAEFPAYMELEPFLATPPKPLPARPRALFVGVLERYKNVDGLAAIWREVAPRVPDASLLLVGRGTLSPVVEDLVQELSSQTTWKHTLRTEEVASALDESTLLVLPSRSEGMGRVVVEALARGRPVVGSRVGGIRDLVEDGVNGLLFDPADHAGFAAGLVRLLTDRAEAERLAAAARPSVERWLPSAESFAANVRRLVDDVVARG
jgi:glycosyltransferase involved in cell wall biosynthesis